MAEVPGVTEERGEAEGSVWCEYWGGGPLPASAPVVWWWLPPSLGAEPRGQLLHFPRPHPGRLAPGLAHLPTRAWHGSLSYLQPNLPPYLLSLISGGCPWSLPWGLRTVPSHQQASITGSLPPSFLGALSLVGLAVHQKTYPEKWGGLLCSNGLHYQSGRKPDDTQQSQRSEGS